MRFEELERAMVGVVFRPPRPRAAGERDGVRGRRDGAQNSPLTPGPSPRSAGRGG